MHRNLFIVLSCIVIAVVLIAVPFEQTGEYFERGMAWRPIWTPINSDVYARFVEGAVLRILWPFYIAQIVYVGLGLFVIDRLLYGVDESNETFGKKKMALKYR